MSIKVTNRKTERKEGPSEKSPITFPLETRKIYNPGSVIGDYHPRSLRETDP
jgi:hypothetical protein